MEGWWEGVFLRRVASQIDEDGNGGVSFAVGVGAFKQLLHQIDNMIFFAPTLYEPFEMLALTMIMF